MHTCTHAHVCKPTHSVPPIPSSALPHVTHACTHTHPNCHALPQINTHPHGPSHSLTHQSLPLRCMPTPSGPDLIPSSPCPLPRQICASTNATRTCTCIHHLFQALPPTSTRPSCPISSCMHTDT